LVAIDGRFVFERVQDRLVDVLLGKLVWYRASLRIREDERNGEQRSGGDENRLLEAAIEAPRPGSGGRRRDRFGRLRLGRSLFRGGLAGAIGAAVESDLLHREPVAGLNPFSNVNMRAPDAHGEPPDGIPA